MGVLSIILLVLFCIVSILLVFLVAIQDEKSSGLGGLFAGNSDSVFGANPSNFITRATVTLAILFMVLSLVVAFVNKSSDADISRAVSIAEIENNAAASGWLNETSTEPVADSSAN